MVTTYEFVVETMDEFEDIIDCPAFDSLEEAKVYALSCENPWVICLRRDTGNDVEGLTERYYAYPDANGKLPEYMETAVDFQDGPPVPKRFREMVFPSND